MDVPRDTVLSSSLTFICSSSFACRSRSVAIFFLFLSFFSLRNAEISFSIAFFFSCSFSICASCALLTPFWWLHNTATSLFATSYAAFFAATVVCFSVGVVSLSSLFSVYDAL